MNRRWPPGHRSLGRRALRALLRLAGEPLGLAALAALRLTARRAGVTLVYHGVQGRAGDPDRGLVPAHEARLFEAQVRFLVRHCDVVSGDRILAAAARRGRGQRFPVAITFDDDLACHASTTLPILRRQGATATFFLSGASLERPFAFPFERLQRAVDEGVPDVAALVTGRPEEGGSPPRIHDLGRILERMSPEERDAASERLSAAVGPDPDDAGIRAEQVRELAEAGMTIGFHTLRHDALPTLDDVRLAEAMRAGREGLATAAGRPIETIAYPHGRADERVADAARAAGFKLGFASQHAPVTPGSDPLLLGRVGPSLSSVGGLAATLPVALIRSGRRRPSPARDQGAS